MRILADRRAVTYALIGYDPEGMCRFDAARCRKHHERADAPRPFEATWRARKSTTSATGIAVSAALCARPGRALLSAGRPKHTDQGRTNRHARASPLPQLHMRKGVNRNPSRRPGLAVSDSNLHAVKTGHSESAAFPGYTPQQHYRLCILLGVDIVYII